MPNSVLTIGHSNQTLEEFKSLLRQHSVTAVADIRTKPYSAYAQWFNQEIIKSELEQSGITYVYLGTELGNQPTDATCYKNGKVSYELMAQTVLFKKGLQRIIEGSKKFSLAIMCVEKEPLECHRSVLHTRELQAWRRGSTETVLIEWDRNLIWLNANGGTYCLSSPALGEPVLEPRPVREWSVPHVNRGHDG
jgi:uncharacterized protein (DUF488 family)